MRDQAIGRERGASGVRARGSGLVLALLFALTSPGFAGPIGTGSGNPRSPAETMDRLAPPLDAEPSGLYAVDLSFNFNTLDAVVYDPKTERLALIGHFDRRFIGPRIPYLQHLAALLEIKDRPHFSLENTRESARAVRARAAGEGYSRDDFFAQFDKALEPDGSITWLGRAILESLGLSPIKGARAPGYLGADVETQPGGGVRVTAVVAGSPANEAGLRAGDVIVRFDGAAVPSAEAFARLVRIAGRGSAVPITYRRDGKSADISVTLMPDPDSDPWLGMRQSDVDDLLPAATKGQPTADRLRDYARSQPDGFQLPPEILQRVANMQVESVPVFFGESSSTQLARLMFEADYSVVKRIGHRVDLEQRLPGYMTLFDYAKLHPKIRDAIGGQRIWVSVASVTLKQSPSGETLSISDAKMRFNMRTLRADGNDAPSTLPEITAYADLLTKLYDELAEDYFALHELREAAKLVAAANWIRQKTPKMRLPSEGRVVWNAPAKVPGMTFAHLSQKRGEDLAMVAHGGIDLGDACIANTRICVIPFDRGVKDPPKTPDLGKAMPGSGVPTAAESGKLPFNGKEAEAVQIELKKIHEKADALRDAVANKPKVVPSAAVEAEVEKLQKQIDNNRPTTPQDKYRQAGMMLNLAMMRHARGEDGKAVDLVRKADEMYPNHPSRVLLRAATDEQEGKRREAIAELRDYVKRVPDNPDAERWLKRLEREEGEGLVRPAWTPPRLQPMPVFGTLGGSGSGAPGARPPPPAPATAPGSTPPVVGGGSGLPGSSSGPRPVGTPPISRSDPPPPTPQGSRGSSPPTGQPTVPGQVNRPPASATTPPPEGPRSAAGTRQIATTTDMADAGDRLKRAKEKFGALEKEVDPCNFDRGSGGGLNANCVPRVSVKEPVPHRVVEPPAATWKERQDELKRARAGWERRKQELNAKPQEMRTTQEKEELETLIPGFEKMIDQEQKKADAQVLAGSTEPPPPLPQTEQKPDDKPEQKPEAEGGTGREHQLD